MKVRNRFLSRLFIRSVFIQHDLYTMGVFISSDEYTMGDQHSYGFLLLLTLMV